MLYIKFLLYKILNLILIIFFIINKISNLSLKYINNKAKYLDIIITNRLFYIKFKKN